MKKFLLICMGLVSILAHAYDFSAVNDDGKTIYYNVISLTNQTCEVIHNGIQDSETTSFNGYGLAGTCVYSNSYSGNLVVPSAVEYKGRTFSVINIHELTFVNCPYLTKLSLPNSIKSIETFYHTYGNFWLKAAPFDYTGIISLTVGNPYILRVFGDTSYVVQSTKPKAKVKEIILSKDYLDDETGITNDFSSGYDALKAIYSYTLTPPSFSSGTHFSNEQKLNLPAYVPEEALEAYQQADVWKDMWELRAMKAVTEISLNETDVTLEPAQTLQVTATVLPEDAFNSAVEWSSSNPEVATVNENGLVTAGLIKGETIITVSATDGSGVTAECKVTVDLKVKELSFTESEITIEPEQTYQIQTTITPDGAFNKALSWISHNESVATVDENGKVTAVAVGTANISATTTDGSDLMAVCKVNVVKLVKSITVSPNTATVKQGDTLMLTATVLPEDATDASVTWSSSNPEVATVSSEGLVTTLSAGNAIIKATANDGTEISDRCVLLVAPLVSEITLSDSEIGLEPGDTKQLTVTVSPTDAFQKDVIWSSDNEAVATVDENGLVTALSVGEANVSATTLDGSNLTATCMVTVSKFVTSIAITPGDATLTDGETLHLTVSVLPDDATHKDVIWTSSNEDVVSVDDNGMITALYGGSAIIKAAATDGSGVFGIATISVSNLVIENSGLLFSKNSSTTLKLIANDEHPYSGDIIVPENTNFNGKEMAVTEIASAAFSGCSELTRVVLPSSIDKIGENAFSGCSKLEYVKISNGSTVACNLDGVFADSPVKELYIGSDNATYNSSSTLLKRLTTLTLGNTISILPQPEAFSGLERFIVEDGNEAIDEPSENYIGTLIQVNSKETVKNRNTMIYYH